MDKVKTEGVYTLSELVTALSSFKFESANPKRLTSTNAIYVFNDPDVDETLFIIHDKYVVVPADLNHQRSYFPKPLH